MTAAFRNLAVAGGGLFALNEIAKAGADLVKVQRDMKMMGVENVDIQKAYAAAWENTAKYTNMSAAEILNMYKNARQIFAREGHPFTHVIDQMEPFIRAGSFLKAYDGGKHHSGAAAHGLGNELFAMMRSAEFAGMIDPQEAAHHVGALIGMKIAFGDAFKAQQYFQNQQAAGVSLRMADPEFRYGFFPALAQIMSGGGVALMTLWQKLGAGSRMNKSSVAALAEAGLLNLEGGFVDKDRNDLPFRLKSAEAIKEHSLFMRNPARWIHDVLTPAIEKMFGKIDSPELQAAMKNPDWVARDWDELAKEIPNREGLEKATAFIGRMFGDRNAMKVVVELSQMWQKLLKDSQQTFQGYQNFMDPTKRGEYMQGSLDYQLESLSTGFRNLFAVLGKDNVGPFVAVLRTINGVVSGMVGYLEKVDPSTLAMVGKALVGVVAAMTGLAGAALITALVAALGPIGLTITALTALAAVNWGAIKAGFEWLSGWVTKLWGMLPSIPRAAAPSLPGEPSTMEGFMPQSFAPGGPSVPGILPPPRQGEQLIQTHTQINLDGMRLADAVAHHIVRRGAHPHSGGQFDGSMSPTAVDFLNL